jgi:hypothetical protein
MSINAIRITPTAMIDKMETYRKNAPVVPRSRIPDRAKSERCMSIDEADGMPPLVCDGERRLKTGHAAHPFRRCW